MQLKITVSGRVQGVSFRAYTSDKAKSLGIKGNTRNLRSGDVEIHAQGDQSQLNALIEWCWQGSPASKVTNVLVEPEDESSFSGFHIAYG